MSAGNCIAIANDSRESMPLEKRFTGVSMCFSIPANSATAPIRSRITSIGMPSEEANRVTFSRPVNSGWNPVPTASSGRTRPWTVSTPPVGRVVPARICSIVDLPEPLVPTIPNDSPRRTLKLTERSASIEAFSPLDDLRSRWLIVCWRLCSSPSW